MVVEDATRASLFDLLRFARGSRGEPGRVRGRPHGVAARPRSFGAILRNAPLPPDPCEAAERLIHDEAAFLLPVLRRRLTIKIATVRIRLRAMSPRHNLFHGRPFPHLAFTTPSPLHIAMQPEGASVPSHTLVARRTSTAPTAFPRASATRSGTTLRTERCETPVRMAA